MWSIYTRELDVDNILSHVAPHELEVTNTNKYIKLIIPILFIIDASIFSES